MIEIKVNEENIERLKVSGSATMIASELTYAIGMLYSLMEEQDASGARHFKTCMESIGSFPINAVVFSHHLSADKMNDVFGENVAEVVLDESQ